MKTIQKPSTTNLTVNPYNNLSTQDSNSKIIELTYCVQNTNITGIIFKARTFIRHKMEILLF